MFDDMYIKIKNNLNIIVSNIDEVIENINKFNNNCSQALVINNMTNYKSSIINIKNELEEKKLKLKNEVIKELENQIMS